MRLREEKQLAQGHSDSKVQTTTQIHVCWTQLSQNCNIVSSKARV